VKDKIASAKEKFYECDQHQQKIRVAKQYLMANMPFTLASYQASDDVVRSFIDQLIYRFSKLQDSMGEKIFPTVLLLSEEEIKRKTFIDILNRLEELALIDRIDWLMLREARNEVAHDYSFNQQQVVESINRVYQLSDQLIGYYQTVRRFAQHKFPELNLSNDYA
jgi:uncharacterized Fe-S cluster-containing MiaB family protein